MSSQPKYEEIEAYLNGTLSGSDLEKFEEQLRTNPELAAELILFQNIDTALSDKPVVDFQKIVQEEGQTFLEKNISQQAKTRIFSLPVRSLSIAAAILVLVLSIFIFWEKEFSTQPTGEALYAQYFDTYNLNQSIRSAEGDNTDFQNGVRQYQAKNFSEAVLTFERLSKSDEKDMVLAFCLGNAYLNQDPPQLNLAKQQFQKVIADDSSIFVPKAKWYSALIELKIGSSEYSKKLLEEVTQSGDEFGKKAKDLLKDLED